MSLINRLLICVILVLACGAVAPAQTVTFTPGQAVEAREGDAWSAATFIKREGHKYDVRYADGTEEWVTLDRLRQPGATGDATAPPADNAAAISTAGPFTQINLTPPAQGVPHRASVAIHLKPATRRTALFTDLTPAAGADLGHPERLIICADTPNIVVAVGQRHDNDTPLLLLNVDDPSTTEERVFTAHEQKVIGAAAGGATLLTQPTSGSLTLHLWQYVDGSYQLRSNYTFVSAANNKHPDWACLLTPTHLLMRCDFGETYLIDLPTRRQLASIKCDSLAVHCGGKLLLAIKDQAAVILRPTDLAIIAQLSDHASGLSVDSTATYAAVATDTQVKILKLNASLPIGHTSATVGRGRLDLLDPSALLVDGSTYYDLKTGIPVWSYKAPDAESTMLANGQMLYVGTIDGQTAACMTALPETMAANALKNVSPDQFLLSPGAHIAIAGDLGCFGNAATARANVEQSLTASGFKPDDAATQFKLTFSSAAGPTSKFSFREFHLETGPLVRTVDAPSTIVTVVLTRDGATIWQKQMNFSAQVMLMVQRNETAEQAAARAAQPDPGRLIYLDVPGHIVKGGETGKLITLGQSELTRTGFASPTAVAK